MTLIYIYIRTTLVTTTVDSRLVGLVVNQYRTLVFMYLLVSSLYSIHTTTTTTSKFLPDDSIIK